MDTNAFRCGQRVPEFEQRDVGILFEQFFEKGSVRGKLSMPFGTSLGQWLSMPLGSDRPAPTCSGRRRELQPQRRRPTAQALFNMSYG